jgi:hypothetical protein
VGAARGIEPLATIVSQGYVADEFAYLARTPAQAGASRSSAPARRSTTSSASRSTRRSRRSRSLDAAARRRRGARERERRRRRARPSDRRVGGRILATMVHELRRNGGGLGSPRSAPAAARATRC